MLDQRTRRRPVAGPPDAVLLTPALRSSVPAHPFDLVGPPMLFEIRMTMVVDTIDEFQTEIIALGALQAAKAL